MASRSLRRRGANVSIGCGLAGPKTRGKDSIAARKNLTYACAPEVVFVNASVAAGGLFLFPFFLRECVANAGERKEAPPRRHVHRKAQRQAFVWRVARDSRYSFDTNCSRVPRGRAGIIEAETTTVLVDTGAHVQRQCAGLAGYRVTIVGGLFAFALSPCGRGWSDAKHRDGSNSCVVLKVVSHQSDQRHPTMRRRTNLTNCGFDGAAAHYADARRVRWSAGVPLGRGYSEKNFD